ncbi:SGNH/GDSL hydrolase family protein [Chryseobacterium sp. G0240]|uniref:SGNH/GDSL hydrolase family protein n=1 Tax=Chryseobacterium sp. G0240 TaxID=2487066 RepID=UPI000F451FD3|nr:SGNH/GDSL hydrolase family protein [Chryseobacterium sp. G0240]ROI02948.1 SGNH/GDSL hydrolase family protein [Chryseobacterium sp. G0240]
MGNVGDVNPNLLIIKRVNDLLIESNPNEILASNASGELVKTKYEDLKSLIVSGSKGEATPTSSPTPWNPGDPDLFEKWDVRTPGTYTNFKDSSDTPTEVTTDDLKGKLVQIWVTNGVAKLDSIPMPQATQNIPNFEDLNFPAIEGIQSIYQDKLWQVKAGQTANITDVPGEDLLNKWFLIGESVTQRSSKTENIKTDVHTSSQYFAESNSFAGFGFNFGVLKGFNQTIIKVGQVVGTSKPVSQVNIRICEGSYTGTELARVNKSVSITEGDIIDVIFDHDLIVNATNQTIWIEFWTNGKTGLFKGNTAGTVPYRYKSDVMASGPTDGFNVNSQDGANPNTRFYLALNNASNEIVLKDKLVTEEIKIGNEKPPKSDAVAKKLSEYDEVITDGYSVDKIQTLGTISRNVNNSTFKGWGQIRGKLTDFNRLGYMFNAFDATMIPTYVRCIVRETNSTGAIIFDQTKPVTMELNVIQKIYFDLPQVYINADNKDIFVSFIANGMISLYGGTVTTDYSSQYAVKYTTSVGAEVLTGTVSNLKYQMFVEVIKGEFEKQVSQKETERIRVFSDPDVLYTSKIYAWPGAQLCVWNKNVVVPKFGDRNDNYVLNFDGPLGKQTARGWVLDPVPAGINQNMTLFVMRGREIIANRSQNVLSGGTNNGNGVTLDYLLISDSTGTNTKINGPIMDDLFSADVMKVRCVGTQGPTGYKNEAISGARVDTFYGPGLPLYKINITVPLSVAPGIGSVYSQGANTYSVDEVNLTNGTGYFSVSIISGSGPTNTGTLNKVSGLGDSAINYSSVTQPVINNFYNPSTQKFDFSYYLSSTGQTFSNNGWVILNLGINDMFSSTTLEDAAAKVEVMISKYNEMIASIKAYNSTIRIGILVTIPPADQNAFGESYSVGQFSEMYRKTGLITWQNRLHKEYDNTTANNNRIYLIPAHLSVDTDYDFPTVARPVNADNTVTEVVQINGVHPADAGNKKMARAIAAAFKYYG